MRLSRSLSHAAAHGPAVAFYALLALAFTYPLVRNLSTHVLSCCDAFQYAWFFWWVDVSLFDPARPLLFTDVLYHPHGTSLAFADASWSNGFLSVPLQRAFGLVPALNLLNLSTYVLGCLSCYLLVFHLTRSRRSSFVAGVSFGFSATHVIHSAGLNFGPVLVGKINERTRTIV